MGVSVGGTVNVAEGTYNEVGQIVIDKDLSIVGAGAGLVAFNPVYTSSGGSYAPENGWVDHFTLEELKKIWEPAAQGKIMKWSQVRPEWPNEEMHLFGPGVASGTYDYFTEAVVGKSGSSRGDFTASEDDHVLVQGIAGDKFALGFFGLAYYSENKDRLKLIGVDNGEEVVKPSLETVKNGSYKPLSRPLFIYVNSTSVASPEVVEFVNFYIDNAGELSKDVGYIPLPDENYNAQKESFKTFVESNK